MIEMVGKWMGGPEAVFVFKDGEPAGMCALLVRLKAGCFAA
jgi:hypothetical protein